MPPRRAPLGRRGGGAGTPTRPPSAHPSPFVPGLAAPFPSKPPRHRLEILPTPRKPQVVATRQAFISTKPLLRIPEMSGKPSPCTTQARAPRKKRKRFVRCHKRRESKSSRSISRRQVRDRAGLNTQTGGMRPPSPGTQRTGIKPSPPATEPSAEDGKFLARAPGHTHEARLLRETWGCDVPGEGSKPNAKPVSTPAEGVPRDRLAPAQRHHQ